MHAFERQDSQQTLADGIREYHRANPGLAQRSEMSPEAQDFFRCHDAIHVVYGCGNALNDEAIVKIASIFGTSAGLRVLRGYRLQESLDIYRRLALGEIVAAIICSVVLVPRTVVRCLRQTRRWPWSDFAQYLDMPLRDLRKEFGIRVAH